GDASRRNAPAPAADDRRHPGGPAGPALCAAPRGGRRARAAGADDRDRAAPVLGAARRGARRARHVHVGRLHERERFRDGGAPGRRPRAGLGASVSEVPAYQTRRVENGAGRLREALAAGAVDAVTFTSSSTARNFAELFTEEERRAWRGRVTIASIGPITAATAAEYGLTTDVMPTAHAIPALARALADY